MDVGLLSLVTIVADNFKQFSHLLLELIDVAIFYYDDVIPRST